MNKSDKAYRRYAKDIELTRKAANRKYRKSKKQRLKLLSQEMRQRDEWVTQRYGSHGHAACGKKQRYDTRAQAQIIAARALDENCHQTDLKVYECPFCGGWHVSHQQDDHEFWEKYISHAQKHLQKQLDMLEPNIAKKVNLDYTKTPALNRLREWDAEHSCSGPEPYQTRRGMKASRKLQQARQLEEDFKEMITQEGLEP